MIYTITLNPAVDYQMEFSDPLHSKGVNLADHAYLHAGGKGINGSMLLSNLGIHSTVLSFLGGFTGSYIEEQIGTRARRSANRTASMSKSRTDRNMC